MQGEDERYMSPSRVSDGPRIDIIAAKRHGDGERRSRISKHSQEDLRTSPHASPHRLPPSPAKKRLAKIESQKELQKRVAIQAGVGNLSVGYNSLDKIEQLNMFAADGRIGDYRDWQRL